MIAMILLGAVSVPAADYIIGEGDTLAISVWGEKELSLSAKVRPDGKITIPAVGEIAAANETARRLQTVLTEKLRGIVKNPLVTVIVTEITNNKAYVFGGGVKSGVFTLNQRTTLLQLLCQIDDVRKADLKRAYVMRDSRKVRENFTGLFIQGIRTDDIVLEPNDVIYVPAKLDKNIYVMGAVNTPKFIEYREGITVVEAILDAGGYTKFASPDNTMIYRRENDQEIKVTVKVNRLINGGDLTQNVPLKPGDYVVVKESLF
jgi:polysaccharide export outer membrane protein